MGMAPDVGSKVHISYSSKFRAGRVSKAARLSNNLAPFRLARLR